MGISIQLQKINLNYLNFLFIIAIAIEFYYLKIIVI